MYAFGVDVLLSLEVGRYAFEKKKKKEKRKERQKFQKKKKIRRASPRNQSQRYCPGQKR